MLYFNGMCKDRLSLLGATGIFPFSISKMHAKI